MSLRLDQDGANLKRSPLQGGVWQGSHLRLQEPETQDE